MKLTTQKEHFLNDEQRLVKQKIMEELFNVLSVNLHGKKFDNQIFTDILLSCLIMFNKNIILINFINQQNNFNPVEIVDHILGIIKK